MKTLLDKVFLLNRTTGKFEGAEVYHGIDANNLAHVEGRWRPMFETRRQEVETTGQTMADVNAEDSHWEWSKKAFGAVNNPLLYDVFVMECGGGTQAIMITCKGGESCFSRHDEHKHAPLVYVELLATAPWNRPGLVAEPVYKGAGRVMIGAAVSLSLEEEFDGRIGLHSLPGAEAFYLNAIHMTDLGVDEEGEHKGLRYLELPSSQTKTFLSKPH